MVTTTTRRYKVTAVPMTKGSRRRAGKSEEVTVEVNAAMTLREVEAWYELEWALAHPGMTCKVFDVREVTVTGRFASEPELQNIEREGP